MTTGELSNDASSPQKGHLPPGMVIGPDGRPCKICTAFRYWRSDRQARKQEADSTGNQGSSDREFSSIASVMGALATGTGSPAAKELVRPDTPPEGCPPDLQQLGRATWTFLHTTAAFYPDNPSPTQRARMLGLLFALPVLFPCSHCASHLGESMQRHPPDVNSHMGVSRWLCERHNEVNKWLGKPLFDCSIKSTDERWKDGPSDERCD